MWCGKATDIYWEQMKISRRFGTRMFEIAPLFVRNLLLLALIRIKLILVKPDIELTVLPRVIKDKRNWRRSRSGEVRWLPDSGSEDRTIQFTIHVQVELFQSTQFNELLLYMKLWSRCSTHKHLLTQCRPSTSQWTRKSSWLDYGLEYMGESCPIGWIFHHIGSSVRIIHIPGKLLHTKSTANYTRTGSGGFKLLLPFSSDWLWYNRLWKRTI